MAEKRALTDIEVHDLLHQALMLLANKDVQTANAHSVLSAAIRNLDILQKALLIMSEGKDPLRTESEP
ncbi:hypothetical protein SAMN05892877_117153 [Rhizobium subbaraonis]|uniref:Uncharacterized protein n=1 Tax=Rhizobium subbaraonis TaxID=908946 RepID=A0A285UV57_9HYPH|nr:hypothetical protein SAMN05892877_117153 [Rhizobium subbaraonis]